MRVYHTKIVAAALVLVATAGTLIVIGASQTGIYYVHTDDFFKEESKYLQRELRINGRVREGSLVRGPQPLHYDFLLGEGAESFRVRYVGPAPDALKEGADVVAEGHYAGGREMRARTLMTKCPSKYEAKDTTAAGSPSTSSGSRAESRDGQPAGKP